MKHLLQNLRWFEKVEIKVSLLSFANKGSLLVFPIDGSHLTPYILGSTNHTSGTGQDAKAVTLELGAMK